MYSTTRVGSAQRADIGIEANTCRDPSHSGISGLRHTQSSLDTSRRLGWKYRDGGWCSMRAFSRSPIQGSKPNRLW